jgi:hypothetical protein
MHPNLLSLNPQQSKNSQHPKKLYFSHQSQLLLDDSPFAAIVREQ